MIRSIDAGWPKSHAKPKFVIIGCGEHAIEAAKSIARHVPPERIDSRIGLPDLRKAADVIGRSSFFLGADGGLMHIAAALKKPGIAIFCEIRPEWRLHARSKMRAFFSEGDINQIPTEKISGEVIRYCEDLLKQSDPRINAGWKPARLES